MLVNVDLTTNIYSEQIARSDLHKILVAKRHNRSNSFRGLMQFANGDDRDDDF
jgi:hypothetical protein